MAVSQVQFALTSITDLIVTTNLLLLSIPCLLHLIYQHAVVDNTSSTLIRVCAIVVLLLVAVALVVLLEVFRFHDRVEVVLLHLNLGVKSMKFKSLLHFILGAKIQNITTSAASVASGGEVLASEASSPPKASHAAVNSIRIL